MKKSEKRVYEFVLSYCRDIFFMCNFLFFAFVLLSQVYAQNWMRLEGNELIDVDAYREIDIAVPPSRSKTDIY